MIPLWILDRENDEKFIQEELQLEYFYMPLQQEETKIESQNRGVVVIDLFNNEEKAT